MAYERLRMMGKCFFLDLATPTDFQETVNRGYFVWDLV